MGDPGHAAYCIPKNDNLRLYSGRAAPSVPTPLVEAFQLRVREIVDLGRLLAFRPHNAIERSLIEAAAKFDARGACTQSEAEVGRPSGADTKSGIWTGSNVRNWRHAT